RLHLAGGVRPLDGDALVHHALSRRHRYDLGADRRGRDRLDAARSLPRLEGAAGHRLRVGAGLDSYLLSERPRGPARDDCALACPQDGGGVMTLLSVANVTKRFGGLVANDSISFDVPERSVFAVIGPNGAGKTTLFNTISGFFPPTEGRIAFDGADITGVAQRKIAARGLVRTYQLGQLFQELTVPENEQIGVPPVTNGANDA